MKNHKKLSCIWLVFHHELRDSLSVDRFWLAHRRQSTQARDPSWLWNPGQTSSEVQNRDISDPTKRTYVLQFVFFKKRIFFGNGLQMLTPYHLNVEIWKKIIGTKENVDSNTSVLNVRNDLNMRTYARHKTQKNWDENRQTCQGKVHTSCPSCRFSQPELLRKGWKTGTFVHVYPSPSVTRVIIYLTASLSEIYVKWSPVHIKKIASFIDIWSEVFQWVGWYSVDIPPVLYLAGVTSTTGWWWDMF